jgi:hypothetical protein
MNVVPMREEAVVSVLGGKDQGSNGMKQINGLRGDSKILGFTATACVRPSRISMDTSK